MSPPYQRCSTSIYFRHFLTGNCKVAIILQIVDRPGFGLFLDRMHRLGLHCEVKELPEYLQVYCAAIVETTSTANMKEGVFTRNLRFPDKERSIRPTLGERSMIRTPLSAFRVITIKMAL